MPAIARSFRLFVLLVFVAHSLVTCSVASVSAQDVASATLDAQGSPQRRQPKPL